MKNKLIIASFAVILFAACKKDKSASTSTDSSSDISQAGQTAVAENYLNESVNVAIDLNDGTQDGSGVFRMSDSHREYGCATVTNDVAAKTVTIDFGTSPCTGPDGKSRSGKIIITYAGKRDSSDTRSIQYINFKRDSIALNGTLSMTGISRSGSVVSFTLQTTGGNFTYNFDSGKTFVVTSFNRSYTIDIGALPFNMADNTTTITGTTFTGVNLEGKTFSVEITSPIVFKGGCTLSGIFYPASGTHKITVGNAPSYNINWGTGDCDKTIVVTILNQSYTITLP
jgi:hypothetical protein